MQKDCSDQNRHKACKKGQPNAFRDQTTQIFEMAIQHQTWGAWWPRARMCDNLVFHALTGLRRSYSFAQSFCVLLQMSWLSATSHESAPWQIRKFQWTRGDDCAQTLTCVSCVPWQQQSHHMFYTSTPHIQMHLRVCPWHIVSSSTSVAGTALM